MISTFEDIQLFVKKMLPSENGIYIPKVPSVSEVFPSKQNYDLQAYLEQCKTFISRNWKWSFSSLKWNEDSLDAKINYWTKKSTSEKPFDIAKATYRDYFLDQYFGGELGDVKYKVIRNRLHYFGLLNYSEHLHLTEK